MDTLAEAGFAPEQLSELIATGAYDLDWASVTFPEPTAQLTTTLEAAAAATGLPQDLAARLFDAWELPRPQPGQVLRADDDELLRLAVPALEGFGGEETALLGPRPTWPAGWSRSSTSSPTAAGPSGEAAR